MSSFKGSAAKISDQDYERAAARLMCDEAAIRAVAKVESGGKDGCNRGKTPGGQAISMQRCLTRIGSGGTGGAPGTLRRSPR